MEWSPAFTLAESDALYVCGTADAFDTFYMEFPESRG